MAATSKRISLNLYTEREDKINIGAFLYGFFLLSIININSTTLSLSRCRYMYVISMAAFLYEYIRKKSINNNWVTKWILCLVIVNFFEMINTLTITALDLKNMLGLFMFIFTLFLACGRSYNAKEIRWIMNMFILTGVIFSLLLIFHGHAYSGFAGRRTVKLGSREAIDPNFMAALILMSFMLTLIKLCNIRSTRGKVQRPTDTEGFVKQKLFLKAEKQMIFVGILLLIQLYAIMLTSSRGAFVSLFVGVFFVAAGYFHNMTLRKKVLFILLGSVGIVFIITMVLQAVPQSQINRLLAFDTYSKGGGAGRLDLWKTSLQLIANRPILGYGFAETGVKYSMIGIEHSFAHNTYLLLFENYGLVGGVVYLSIYARITWKLWKRKNKYFFGFWAASCSVIFFFAALGGLMQVLPLIMVVIYLNFIENGGEEGDIFI